MDELMLSGEPAQAWRRDGRRVSRFPGAGPRRRVVVTGIGLVTALGNDVGSSWNALLAAECGVDRITLFDHSDYPVHFAAEAKDFAPTTWIDRKTARRMDRFAQLIVAAARQAEADSGLDVRADAERIGASIATCMGGIGSFQDCYDLLKTRGADRVNPFSIPSIIPNMGAGWVSIELGTKGPLMSQCTACAASNMAIGDALDQIRLGRVDAMIAGGGEAAITGVGIAGFDAMRALSRRNNEPSRASRPFDNGRDGIVLGEGAGILVLEELERARRRGARIYAELVGYGMSADASHMTEPDPTGAGAARSMQAALADAGVDASELGYVNAHATSTRLGDAAEARALELVLGDDHARSTPISSTKGATGHTFGAAGAIEAIFTALALHDRVVPPTINYDEADPNCDLDCVPNEARAVPELELAASNSFGFGGHNATIVLRRYDA